METALLLGRDLDIGGREQEDLIGHPLHLAPQAVGEAATSLREGEGLASELSRTNLFPTVALDLIQIGDNMFTFKLTD